MMHIAMHIRKYVQDVTACNFYSTGLFGIAHNISTIPQSSTCQVNFNTANDQPAPTTVATVSATENSAALIIAVVSTTCIVGLCVVSICIVGLIIKRKHKQGKVRMGVFTYQSVFKRYVHMLIM